MTQNLTLHYDRMMLILEPTQLARGLVRRKVEVVNYPDGRFAVQFNGRTLPFRMFDKIQTVQPGTIVDNKRLSAVLAMVKVRQAGYEPKRQRGHVARQRPPNNLEAPGLADRTAFRVCRSRATASRAALRAPARRLRPLTPPLAPPARGNGAVSLRTRPPCAATFLSGRICDFSIGHRHARRGWLRP